MENVILIKVESLTELALLEPNQNFIVLVTNTKEWYRGDGVNPPIKIFDENTIDFESVFLLMGA